MAFNYTHTMRRLWAYVLLLLLSIVLLGLTADNIHFTTDGGGDYEPIVVELLVTAILTILWAPVGIWIVMHYRLTDAYVRPRYTQELIGAGVFWAFYLAGAVTFTNLVVPGKNYCPSGDHCDKLVTILAVSWTNWSLLSIIIVFALTHRAAAARPVTTNSKA